ncbi:hypothetical protein GGI15_000435 [Coemansia interrupta]|uniref:NmrA-like domain-containing protein n=1 Tax=Coemansia interrupta TaxID=1126814 RepID=A0A9W8HR54_9FUNG|nr:hypothetical protein GGI15_000435 [Coemansia interrupta]
MSYMKWQFVHNTLGAASGVLSTQALLYAMGLGAGALPLSAAINWVIKDGFGQLGGVLYATMVGQKFDSDPKHLRFWSSVWLQSATWLEMFAPLAPHLFIPIGSAANVGKNISWLAMSATKASINKTFCLKENLGDLTAKHGSQATAAGLLGTAAGILIGATMDITIYTLIVGFVPISLLSLWGNYKSLLCTITPSLNLERASHMVGEAVSVDHSGQLVLDPYMLKSPRQVSDVERFVRETKHIYPDGMLPGITLLPDISKIHRELPSDVADTKHKQAIVAEMVSSAFCPRTADGTWSENYYIGYLSGSTANKSRNGNIYLWFNTHATSRDMLFGLYHSIALRQLLGQTRGVTLALYSMDTKVTRVALIGIGNLAKFFIDELKQHPSEFAITLVTRHESLDKTKSFVAGEPQIPVCTVDYGDEFSISEAFSNQDVVISLLAFGGEAHQIAAVKAAIKAGVKWFIPSEFGVDLDHPTNKKFPFFAQKLKVRQLLESQSEMAYTYVLTGLFADQFLIPFRKWDTEAGTVVVPGDGTAKNSFTARKDVAAYTVAILRRPDQFKNTSARLASYTLSYNEWIEAVDRVSGRKFKTTFESVELMEDRVRKSSDNLGFSVIADLLAITIANGDQRLDWGGHSLDSVGLEEVTPTPLDDIIALSF